MPQSLVSDQLNQDVMRGFLTGFQHAAALIQSRQQQEQENQRQQKQIEAQAQQHEANRKEQYALKAMELGVKADEFKQKSAKERSDEINKNTRAAALNVLSNQRQQYASELAANRKDITNTADYERVIRSTDKKILALGELQPGPDGILDQKQVGALLQEDVFIAPKLKPEVEEERKLKLQKEHLGVQKQLIDIAKGEKSLSGEGDAEKKYAAVQKGIAKTRNAFLATQYKYSTAANLVNTGRKQYGSDQAWAEAAQSDPRVKDFRTKALGDLNSSNSWSAAAIPFLQALSDPSIVGGEIAHLVNSTKGDYNNLSSPLDYSNWVNDVKEHPDYGKLYKFITGNAGENAAANVALPAESVPNQQEGDN